YDVRDIAFSVLGGEPLLREDLFEVMGYAHDLGYSWGLSTNGLLIGEKTVRLMKETGMSAIMISLDGTRETHDNFRGISGGYDKAVESVRMMKEAGFLDMIQIATVFSKANLDQRQELYECVKGSGADSWQILTMEPVGRANQNKDLLLDMPDYKILFDFTKKIRKERKLNVTYGHSHFIGIDYEMDIRDSCFTCQAGISAAGILHNGDVFVCPAVPRLPEYIQGNIRERDFCDIWENEFKLFRDENRTSCGKCKECEHWQFCYGGAFHTWNHEENKQNICLGGLR
ncbi:MAG: radical SAM protein, partial [Defluviitaleaceae bacterium]|nr:radical SAM protein [Defluviitaleaceae bacterium]